MLEWLNAVACVILLALLWPVAFIVHSWRATILMIPVTVAVGLQAVNPLSRWLGEVVWTQTCVNVALAVVVLIFRRELWAMVRYKVGHRSDSHLHRRADDVKRAVVEGYGGSR